MQSIATTSSSVTIPLPISPGVVWFLFLLAAAVFCAATWIFMHHWSYYGIAGNNRVFAKGVYFFVGIGLLVLMVLFASAYSVTT